MKITTLCRALKQEDNDNREDSTWFFKGPQFNVVLGRYAYIKTLEDQCALWYFNFIIWDKKAPTSITSNWKVTPIYSYLGVFDIDLVFPTEFDKKCYLDYKFDRSDYLFTIIATIKAQFEGICDYIIYTSGSKGFHVYTFSNKLFVRSNPSDLSRENVYNYMLNHCGLDSSFLDLIDFSIYRFKSGIRPYSQQNPKTGRFCLNIYESYLNQENEMRPFWWWIYDCLSNANNIDELPILPSPDVRDMMHDSQRLLQNNTTVRINVENYRGLESIKDILYSKINENVYFVTKEYENSAIKVHYPKNADYCFIANRAHKKIKTYWLQYDNCMVQKCFSNGCQNNFHIVRENTVAATDFCKDDQDKLDRLVEYKYIEQVNGIYLPDNCLADALERNDHVLLSAPMGSGKTTQLIEYVEKNKCTYLIIAIRRCQAMYFTDKFPGAVNYEHPDLGYSLANQKRLVLCINSLQRILGNDHEVPQYDLLILDEMQSILNCLVSSLLAKSTCNQNSVFNLLKVLIYRSKKVIMMDGLPDKRLADYLDDIGIWQLTSLLVHNIQPDAKMYTLVDNPYYFSSALKNAIFKDKKRVVLVTNSKRMAEQFYQEEAGELNNDEKLIIYGSSTMEERWTASNPNDHWKDLKFLVYNTSLGPGPSFDLKQFDKLFFLYTCSYGLPSEMYQLLGRVRNYNDPKVIVYIKHNDGPTDCKSKNQVELEYKENIVDYYGLQNRIPVNFYVPQVVEEEEQELISGELREMMLGGGLQRRINHQITPTTTRQTTINHELVLNRQNAQIMRQICSTKKVYAKYENDAFINAASAFRYEVQRYSSSLEFTKKFIDLLTKNGACVHKMNKEPVLDKQTIKIQQAFDNRKLNLTGRKNAEYYENLLQGLNNNDKVQLFELLDLNDPNKQFRFSKLYNCLLKGISIQYTNELIFDYKALDPDTNKPPNKAIGMTVQWSVVADLFCGILQELGLEFNLAEDRIDGSYTKIGLGPKFLDTKLALLEKFFREIQKDDFRKRWDSKLLRENNGPQRRETILAKRISVLFEWVGLIIETTKLKRVPTIYGPVKRIQDYSYCINPKVLRARIALYHRKTKPGLLDEFCKEAFNK